jgi:hypothetical protein
MTAALITLALGVLIMTVDWHLATKPDADAKIKRRKPLNPIDRRHLRDMFFGTVVAVGAVWMLTKAF